MFSVRINNPLSALAGNVAQQVGFAVLDAVDLAANAACKAVIEEMPRVFDRPTPFTMNAHGQAPFYVQPFEPHKPYAEIRLAYEQRYLTPQIVGGERNLRRFEQLMRDVGVLPWGWFVVPGEEAERDGFGNVNPGQLIKILTYVRALRADTYMNRNGRGRRMRRDEKYVVILPDYYPCRYKMLAPGIYKRDGKVDLRPVLMFVRPVSYERRLDVNGIVSRVVVDRLPALLASALATGPSPT